MSASSVEVGKVDAGRRLEPDWRTSKMGYKFDSNDDVWLIDGSTTISFSRAPILEDMTARGFRKALCRYAEELSASTTENVFFNLKRFCDQTGARDICVPQLTNWRSQLSKENEWWLADIGELARPLNVPGRRTKVSTFADQFDCRWKRVVEEIE